MSTISTHVLDTSTGKPVAGVRVTLERLTGPEGVSGAVGSGTTDEDGRLRDLTAAGVKLEEGTYRLRFEVADYFSRTSRDAFYPEIIVVFRVGSGNEHYHVPLLVSPFG